MARVYCKKRIIFKLDSSTAINLAVGENVLDDHCLDHWFIQGLIQEGNIEILETAKAATVEHEATHDADYATMTVAELKEVAKNANLIELRAIADFLKLTYRQDSVKSALKKIIQIELNKRV